MKYNALIAILLFSVSARAQIFDEKTTNSSNVRLNVSNSGTYGNAMRGYRDGSGNPSGEYPAGSGVEHVFESGIWFGGLINGSTVAVSTASVDAPQGYSTGSSGFEFYPEPGDVLREISSLRNSPYYSPNAVSHQDFIATYSDRNVQVPGTQTQIAGHLDPLNIEVTSRSYNWNYSFSDFFVILDFEIENTGNNTIDSAYFGLWANTVVRNINITPAGSGGAAFYNKGGNGYFDSLQMAYCYDNAGDVGFTDSYVGQKFLGAEDKNGFQHPEANPRFNAHYNAWQFNSTSDPIFFQPSNDNTRYQKMTRGLNDQPCWNATNATNSNCGSRSYVDQLNQAGNRSDLVSVGPFLDFSPGDKVKVSYAFIFGKKKEDGNPNSENNKIQRSTFLANASWAQTAYSGEDVNFNGQLDAGEDIDGDGKLTRFILPAPPEIPNTKVVTSDNKIEIYWDKNAEESIDPISQLKDFEGYRLYMTKLGFDVTNVPSLQRDLVKIGEYDIANNGFNYETGFAKVKLDQPATFEGDDTDYEYKFTVNNVLNGWQYAISVTAFDRGNEESNLESLESSPLANNFRAFAGKPVNENLSTNAPFAYPNPYYAGASWEGKSSFQEQSRKLYFANLPANCEITVFSAAGDFLDQITHNAQYDGSDIRWNQTFGAEDASQNVYSGGEHAWDLLTENTQIISRGLYIFTVKDLDTGKLYKDKFAVIK
ncbi:MAG: hypothetical protein P8N47_03390 [Bacteroidia bacterium]|jgi:hypothetical protein|nr:hypothetical protein [Bacteroidia bacterium]